jgi:hypothetical protein
MSGVWRPLVSIDNQLVCLELLYVIPVVWALVQG